MIHYVLWLNSAVVYQDTDRAYRIGQRSSVSIYPLPAAEIRTANQT